MGQSESSMAQQYKGNPVFVNQAKKGSPMMDLTCQYARESNNQGFDDIFDDHTARHKSKCKELKQFAPYAPRSQTDLRGSSDMSIGKFDMDQTGNLAYRPNAQTLTAGKRTVPNVTHMSKYGSGEFSSSSSRVDSSSKHVGFRVRDI
jgi:hypothetical protein